MSKELENKRREASSLQEKVKSKKDQITDGRKGLKDLANNLEKVLPFLEQQKRIAIDSASGLDVTAMRTLKSMK